MALLFSECLNMQRCDPERGTQSGAGGLFGVALLVMRSFAPSKVGWGVGGPESGYAIQNKGGRGGWLGCL